MTATTPDQSASPVQPGVAGRYLRTDRIEVEGTEIVAGTLVDLDGAPHRFVAKVENIATGAWWVDLTGEESHRYRSVRLERLRLR